MIKKSNKSKLLLTFIAGAILIFSPNIVSAKKTLDDAGLALESTVNPTGLPKTEIATYIGSVAQWLFGILGLLFFGLSMYAGFVWFTARGEDERITKARQTLITAIIGLIITVSAYAIATFISNTAILGH